MASGSVVAAVDTVEDFGPGKQGQAKRWMAELDSAKKAEEKFIKSGELTVRRYLYERDATEDGVRKYSMLWANVNTLRPAVYAKPPSPEVSRRFDTNNQVNRVAALIMERNLHYTVCEHSMFDATLKQCVEDRLLPGRGTAWVRYVASMQPMYAGRPAPLPAAAPAGGPIPAANEPMPVPPVTPDAMPAGAPGLPGMAPAPTQPPIEQLPPGPLPMGGAPQPTPMPPPTPPQDPALQNRAVTDDSYESQVIAGERVAFDYVHWKDFRMSPCRTWEECCWVARRVFMTRESGVKRFGDMFAKVPLNYTEPKNDAGRSNTMGNEMPGPGKSVFKKAAVWEIWSKDDLKVYWLCEDWPEILDVRDDLFQLDDFFPAPKPLLATTTSDSTIPVPDYRMYQDQAEELDILTQRISKLMQAVKVVGAYDKSQGDALGNILTNAAENTFVPADNWAMFAEKGGIKGTIDMFPVDLVMEVLTKLIEARSVIKQDIYEITGIADIVRGASVATETATAQAIKERFANIRISDLQKDVARFASDLVNMTAQLMTNFFQPETLVVNADLADPMGPDFQYVPQAVQLVKDGKLIQHKISVSVDAITEEDDREQKAERSEFLDRFSNFLQQSATAMQTMPQIGPLLGHIMLWTVRGFKVGRDIEGELEQQIEQMSKAPPQEKPDPAAEKAQMEMQLKQQESAAKQQSDQAQLALDQQQAQQKLAQDQQENDLRLSFLREENALRLEFMREENAMKLERSRTEAAARVSTAVIDGQVKLASHAQDAELAEDAHERSMEQQADAARVKKESGDET